MKLIPLLWKTWFEWAVKWAGQHLRTTKIICFVVTLEMKIGNWWLLLLDWRGVPSHQWYDSIFYLLRTHHSARAFHNGMEGSHLTKCQPPAPAVIPKSIPIPTFTSTFNIFCRHIPVQSEWIVLIIQNEALKIMGWRKLLFASINLNSFKDVINSFISDWSCILYHVKDDKNAGASERWCSHSQMQSHAKMSQFINVAWGMIQGD